MKTQTIILDGQPVEVPEWARWVATDANGETWAFELTPDPRGANESWWACGRGYPLGWFAVADWHDSLRRVSDLKRKIVLRTHSGVPRAPEWAKRCKVHVRTGITMFDSQILPVSTIAQGDYEWKQRPGFANVIAVEWLP